VVFPALARDFVFFPEEGKAFSSLSPFLGRLPQIAFDFRIVDPMKNQGQLTSTFDNAFRDAVNQLGASVSELRMPSVIQQRHDFQFATNNKSIAVEIEKTNREKILRDILKCHIYLRFGFDFCLLVLPKNYPHKHSVWDLFDFGVQRLKECMEYGFGVQANLERILLIGFETVSKETGERHSIQTRKAMRLEATANH
jgi:hypothetical protein